MFLLNSYSRAEKQARAASQRIQTELQERPAATAKSKRDTDAGQGTLDFTKTT